MVYDITNRSSFNDIKVWYDDICQYSKKDVSIILIGNKKDLTSKREVLEKEGEKLSKDLECYSMETSAKDFTNIEEAFNILIDVIYEREVSSRDTDIVK